MIHLQLNLIRSGCAQGKYIIKARGFMLAVLRWGNRDEAFGDWSPFAYVPIDPVGNGVFFFLGLRGLPPGATHVWVGCHTADFDGHEDAAFAIPDRYLPSDTPNESGSRFSVLTDLHLTDKPWKIKQALRTLQTDTVLLLGMQPTMAFRCSLTPFWPVWRKRYRTARFSPSLGTMMFPGILPPWATAMPILPFKSAC